MGHAISFATSGFLLGELPHERQNLISHWVCFGVGGPSIKSPLLNNLCLLCISPAQVIQSLLPFENATSFNVFLFRNRDKITSTGDLFRDLLGSCVGWSLWWNYLYCCMRPTPAVKCAILAFEQAFSPFLFPSFCEVTDDCLLVV